jgi:dihydrofolate reductase
MRKVVGGLFTSLDGVVEAELLPQPQAAEWTPFYADMQDFMVEAINEQDAVLLGRGTYQAWAAFGPPRPPNSPLLASLTRSPSTWCPPL